MNERGYDLIFYHTNAHEGGPPSPVPVPTPFTTMYPLVLTTNHHLTNPPTNLFMVQEYPPPIMNRGSTIRTFMFR